MKSNGLNVTESYISLVYRAMRRVLPRFSDSRYRMYDALVLCHWVLAN